MEKLEKFLKNKTEYVDGYLLIKYEDVAEFYALILGESIRASHGMEKLINWDGYSIVSGISPSVRIYRDCIAIEVEALKEEDIEDDILYCINEHCLYYA